MNVHSSLQVSMVNFVASSQNFCCAFTYNYWIHGTGVKNPPANAGDTRDMSLIPGSGRSPRVENGEPPQYSCLENPMNKSAWKSMVHRVTKSQIGQKQLSTAQHNTNRYAQIFLNVTFIPWYSSITHSLRKSFPFEEKLSLLPNVNCGKKKKRNASKDIHISLGNYVLLLLLLFFARHTVLVC